MACTPPFLITTKGGGGVIHQVLDDKIVDQKYFSLVPNDCNLADEMRVTAKMKENISTIKLDYLSKKLYYSSFFIAFCVFNFLFQ